MNKNLRLSLIAVVCSLAITACSSSNKGATRYENLVKNKTEEAIKKAEEKVKRAQDSETAKKLADLEKKKKELEAELAKKQNDNADAVEKKEPVVVNPADTANARVLTAEEAKKALEKAFKDNGLKGNTIKLSGAIATANADSVSINSIADNIDQNLNTLLVDGKTITLYSSQDLIKGRSSEEELIKDLENNKGKVGSLPKSALKSNFEQMRYGYITENGVTKLFVQGFMTPTNGKKDSMSPFNYYDESKGRTSSAQRQDPMPTEGIFEYNGKAFYGKDNQYIELNTTAYADINNKKVQVNLFDKDTKTLTFGGSIVDNKFSGTVDGITTEGAFYGTGAKDLAGLFYNTTDGKNGVYGASQKDCGWSTCTPPNVDISNMQIIK
ncbi:transferrin-binding protein-like solute binding protein [Actinobacillus equuli]|uniref:transferrin-binding protein-like solute binding protein n=1 Tax=Actinobacillus equuli TaxID=718 RepID=UPI00244159BE|nr:transferrin-binding protein-like solute binding protein [Actinobacillus equuli]WGE56500.1 transferrin-binding protein-like solute binding protein [Actinobacillus equuli subsp. equuli]